MRVRLKRKAPQVIHILMGTERDIERGRGEPVVTAETARKFLGVSDGKFRLLVDEGAIAPVAKIGKGFLFRSRDVEALKAMRDEQ